MDKETGLIKKREFTVDILENDLFPHCKTQNQKVYLLGYMAAKLISASLDWISADDRDSYLNKRVELTGTLLNNLFRNYFNKLVKEMQKQVVREINTGSWRSSEDYGNIINMTNIYKIMKSTTIENGINRALSTGDFSIKQSNSSKVGVAQVLNRLTYVSSLSHLRRINTPLEKSGELIAPRKLHNTTWGFLCPAETPEGQSIGVVKNISYMAHITIPTNSSALYEYVKPFIVSFDDIADPNELYGKVKVFVNGAWQGITNVPDELYKDLKQKKYTGIINIYTSIIFDYKTLEIRVCSDGGRLTRPVLRVRDNKALITSDIINSLVDRKLTWNDLLTNCNIDEAVIEYIKEEVWMASGIKKPIGEIKIGEKVLSFNPTSMEISTTTVINQFVRKNEYPIYKLTTISGRTIIATEDHKFMTDHGWKTVKELIYNNQLKIGICMKSFNSIESSSLSENIRREYIATNMSTNNYKNLAFDEWQSNTILLNEFLFINIHSITTRQITISEWTKLRMFLIIHLVRL